VNDEVLNAEARLVADWVRPALGPAIEVRFGAVGDSGPDAGKALLFTLLDLARVPAPRRGTAPAPLQLRARYLVSTLGFEAGERAQCLAELAFQAGPQIRVELDPSPAPGFWQALGTAARPALIAVILLERERPSRPVPRVRAPLITRWAPTRPVTGIIMGPGSIPIAGALIELEGSPESTYSNARGEFGFRSVPGTDPPPKLVVRTKGTELRVPVSEDRLVIQVPIPASES